LSEKESRERGKSPLEVVETNRRYAGGSSGRGDAYPSVFFLMSGHVREENRQRKNEKKKGRKEVYDEMVRKKEKERGTEEKE
jgi:hypothetical protein